MQRLRVEGLRGGEFRVSWRAIAECGDELLLCFLECACQSESHFLLVDGECLLSDLGFLNNVFLVAIGVQVEAILIGAVFALEEVGAELGRPIRSSNNSSIVVKLIHILPLTSLPEWR